MPKQKTHRGAAKRFSLTKTGKVKHKKMNVNHILNKKTTKRIRHLRAGGTLQNTGHRLAAGGDQDHAIQHTAIHDRFDLIAHQVTGWQNVGAVTCAVTEVGQVIIERQTTGLHDTLLYRLRQVGQMGLSRIDHIPGVDHGDPGLFQVFVIQAQAAQQRFGAGFTDILRIIPSYRFFLFHS